MAIEERYKSSRFLGGLLLSVLWFGFKFLFTLLLIVMAIGEWSLVGWKMRRFPIAGSEELAYWAEWLYVVMMAVILLYLIVWTVAGFFTLITAGGNINLSIANRGDT